MGLVRDAAGNLYGATFYGGDLGCTNGEIPGCGVVFKVDTNGKETVLHTFAGGADGAYPLTALIPDSAGNLYGTTNGGGDESCQCGTVFKLDKAGKKTVLHTFTYYDGGGPLGDLIRDAGGVLYGSNLGGGTQCNCGTVFKLGKTGKETVLHSFSLAESFPNSLVQDASHNLYGTTSSVYNVGRVFKVDKAGKFAVLYSFKGGSDGAFPLDLVRDTAGNFYGTTGSGGDAAGDGVVFKLTP